MATICARSPPSDVMAYSSPRPCTTAGSRRPISERFAIHSRLTEVLFDLHLDRGERLGRVRTNGLLEACRQQLRQHLDGGIRNRQQSAIAARERVARLAVDADANDLAILVDLDAIALEREQHQMVDFVAEPFHDPLQLDEIEHEPRFFVERALDRDPHAVVMTVQTLAPMARERDEVGGREDEIVLGDRNAVIAPRRHDASQSIGPMDQPPTMSAAKIAAAVRSAAVPGFARLRRSRSDSSIAAIRSRPSSDRTPPAASASAASCETRRASVSPPRRTMCVSGVSARIIR